MELTIESAFSTGGMVGNASYILLILSMAMRDMFWLRLLAIFSGLAGIAYDAIWLTDPVGTFWESLFTLTNLVQWLWLVYDKKALQLSDKERKLRDRFFPQLPDLEFKQLIDHATPVSIEPGGRLTSQGQAVPNLYVITRGDVDIQVDGKVVSSCRPGDYIGEMSYLTGTAATATTIARTPVSLLCFEKDSLASLVKTSDKLGLMINSIISANLSNKLAIQSRL